jgi:hypothetical protein
LHIALKKKSKKSEKKKEENVDLVRPVRYLAFALQLVEDSRGLLLAVARGQPAFSPIVPDSTLWGF